MVETQTIDNGLEFSCEGFSNFCKRSGITRHGYVRHTSQQSGVA